MVKIQGKGFSMWPVFDELIHDDPQHHFLAICLIWWIPLLLIPIAWWALSRVWNGTDVGRRWMVLAVLLFPICVSAIQFSTSWSLAGHWAPLVVDPLAVASYACLIAIIWISFRRWTVRLICALFMIPVAGIAFASFTTILLLINLFSVPHAFGRLSPTVSWRTDWTSMSFTSDWVAYTIFTNPRWLPLVKREIADDRCFTSEIVQGNPAFRISSGGESVVVSCRQQDGEVEDKFIRIQ
jgi:hypothetical protein